MRNMNSGLRRAAQWLVVSAATWCSHSIANPTPGPSVREVVEFTRIIQPAQNDPGVLRSLVSPGGARAFVVTRRAEVSTDENVFEILLLDLRPALLLSGRADAPRTLLIVKSRSDENYFEPSIGEVRWADDRTLVLASPQRVLPPVRYPEHCWSAVLLLPRSFTTGARSGNNSKRLFRLR